MQAIRERRIGCFRVSFSALSEDEWTEERNVQLFGDMVIIRAEHDVASGCMEYCAYSMLFDPVEVATSPPWYRLEPKIEGDRVTVIAEKSKYQDRSFWGV